MFFDEPYNALPKDAQYYFNILIICIAVSPQYAQEIFQQNIIDMWNIQNINDGRPFAVHIYTTHHINKDFEYELQCLPHQVLEVDPKLGISFYEMIDYDTDDPWRLDPSVDEID